MLAKIKIAKITIYTKFSESMRDHQTLSIHRPVDFRSLSHLFYDMINLIFSDLFKAK